MNDQDNDVKIQAASVSDRGLSEKRPLNEDAFLADSERRIFAVADGVGGAQAGEVASQTAMEVLDEAFRHQTMGADVEDLMEIAIQRANSSIHRMSHEHPKLSMMATTIVALYLDNNTATIGHVGDSRLYRLSPDGSLHRETQDHSVVEEEVRAGRMTPDQAANHPSRNVISRALGAEDTVEVDLKTIEIEDGTAFLLCTDGITRHIDDVEIRDLLSRDLPIEQVCEELKKRCYERGAEDNLTAIVVKVGAKIAERNGALAEDDSTISIPRPSGIIPNTGTQLSPESGVPSASAPTRIVYAPPQQELSVSNGNRMETAAEEHAGSGISGKRTGFARAAWLLVSLLLVLVSGLAGYLAGKYKADRDAQTLENERLATAVPTPTPVDPAVLFDQRRREVDKAPQAMLKRMTADSGGRPLDSSDPQFLYLYGRALLLSGKPVEANEALKKAAANLQDRSPRDPMKIDAKFSEAVAALRTGNWQTAQTASKQIEEVIQREDQDADGSQPQTSAP